MTIAPRIDSHKAVRQGERTYRNSGLLAFSTLEMELKHFPGLKSADGIHQADLDVFTVPSCQPPVQGSRCCLIGVQAGNDVDDQNADTLRCSTFVSID